MPPLVNSRAQSACGDEPGMSWYHCSGPNSDKLQKSFRESSLTNQCDLGRCLYIRNVDISPDVLIRSLGETRELNTAINLTPVAQNSQNTSSSTITPTSEATNDSDPSENLLQWPLIALITIAAITFLLYIFTTLFVKRRKKEDVEMPFLKEEFAKDHHSPSSSLLNQQIDYEEYHQKSHKPDPPQYVPVKDAPIPDLEKTELVEPPINSHPAFKNTHHSYLNRPEGEITSPENYTSLSSASSSHQLLSRRLEPSDYLLEAGSIDLSQVPRVDSSSQERRNSNKNSISGSQGISSPYKTEKESDFPPSFGAAADLGHRNIPEDHKFYDDRETTTSISRKSSSKAPSTWVEVFPRTKPVKSILSVPSKWGRSAKPKLMSKKPSHIRLSTDRWSGSTLTSNLSTNAASDWCISGDWGKSTQYDNVMGYLSGTMNPGKEDNQRYKHGLSENDPNMNLRVNLSNHFRYPSPTSSISECCSISSTKSCEISEDQSFKYNTQFYKTGREGNESIGAITWGSWMER